MYETVSSAQNFVDLKQVNPFLLLNLIGDKTHGAAEFLSHQSAIDLSWATPAMQEMIQEGKLVYMLSEKEREQYVIEAKEEAILMGFGEDPEFQGVLMDEINAQHVAERARVIFLAGPQPHIEWTEIIHGEYEFVKSSLLPGTIFLKEGTPLISMHTHPNNGLFTPPDYLRLLTRKNSILPAPVVCDDQTRLVYASLVICPDIQVLALATDLTPLFPYKKAELFIEQIILKDAKEFSLITKSINVEGENENDFLRQVITANKERFISAMRDLRRRVNGGEISEEERGEELGKFLESCGSVGVEVVHRIKKRKAVEKQFENEKLVGVSQVLNLRLYSSTNMRDFTAFTA